jgi:hypothetical protein
LVVFNFIVFGSVFRLLDIVRVVAIIGNVNIMI